MTAGVSIRAAAAWNAAGETPAAVFDAALAGRTAIRPFPKGAADGWRNARAGFVDPWEPDRWVPDRKTRKWIRRTDVLGLGVLGALLRALPDGTIREESGLFSGSGGGAWENLWDFLPGLAAEGSGSSAFGDAVSRDVHPAWLLRSLPNNVSCHAAILHGFRGRNDCVTAHASGGSVALLEGFDAVREGAIDRAGVVAHDSPLDTPLVFQYDAAGLLADGELLPWNVAATGTVFGEGAAALWLGTSNGESAPASGSARILGGAMATEDTSLVAVRDDGDGPARALRLALADAGLSPADVALVVGHGNGNPASDRSEGAAIVDVFGTGADAPMVTSFKWLFGHTLAASGLVDVVLAIESLDRGVAPACPGTDAPDPLVPGLRVARKNEALRPGAAVVLNRAFGGSNTAIVVAGPDA